MKSRQTICEEFLEHVDLHSPLNRLLNTRSTSTSLRIITFNVHSWANIAFEKTADQILDIIRQLDADVVCLQEVLENDDVFNVLKEMYCEFYFCSTGLLGSHEFGNLIMSRLPIIKRSDRLLGRNCGQERSVMKITVKHPRSKEYISIFNCHLDVYDDSERVRLEQLVKIRRFMNRDMQHYRCILCGDFNSIHHEDYTAEEWQTILAVDQSRRITTPTKAQTYIRENIKLTNSFRLKNMLSGWTVWSQRIVDFIFFSQRWTDEDIINTETYFTSTSDHLPVLVDLY